MCFSKLEYIATIHDIKLYAEDFEAVPADFYEYLNFVTSELDKHFNEPQDFKQIQIHFVKKISLPSDSSGKMDPAGGIVHHRPWPWSPKLTYILIRDRQLNNEFWKSFADTAFSHELILHVYSTDYYKNYDHKDKSLELLLNLIDHNWRVSRAKQQSKL